MTLLKVRFFFHLKLCTKNKSNGAGQFETVNLEGYKYSKASLLSPDGNVIGTVVEQRKSQKEEEHQLKH